MQLLVMGAFRNGHSMTASQMPDQQPSSGPVLSLFTDRSFLSSEGRDQMTTGLEEIARDMGLTGLTCRCERRSGDECVQGAREFPRRVM